MRSRMCAQGRHHLCHGSLRIDGDQFSCECECHGQLEEVQWDDYPWDAFGNFGHILMEVDNGENLLVASSMLPVIMAATESN